MKIKLVFDYKTDKVFQDKLDSICNADDFCLSIYKLFNDTSTGTTADCTWYRQAYEKAIELGIEREFSEIGEKGDWWCIPKPLTQEHNLQAFPVNELPDVLKNYMLAVSAFGQVPAEMCALPMLSVLAMCCQGKARVKQHYSSYTHELTLYTLTVAPSSARKSPALKAFLGPVYEFQRKWNESHDLERIQRQTERQFYENEKMSFLKGSKRDLGKAKEIDETLQGLPEIHHKSLICTDITPEALSIAMSEQGEKMGVFDAESGILTTLAGAYTSGVSNIDLILKAFDGEYCERRRITSGTVTLKHPLLSMGLLCQPKKFGEFITNCEFVERGLCNRFLYAFPKAPERYTDIVPEIPKDAKNGFYSLISRLLSLPESDIVITHDRESQLIMHDMHVYIQDQKAEGIFKYIPEYGEKAFANVLKIAALLHLCEHAPTEPINGKTAKAAASISMWCFNHALAAFGGEQVKDATTALAEKIIIKLASCKESTFSMRDICRLTHQKRADISEAVDLLINCYYLRDNEYEPTERGYTLTINPIIRAKK